MRLGLAPDSDPATPTLWCTRATQSRSSRRDGAARLIHVGIRLHAVQEAIPRQAGDRDPIVDRQPARAAAAPRMACDRPALHLLELLQVDAEVVNDLPEAFEVVPYASVSAVDVWLG